MNTKINDTVAAWEDRALGADENHVGVADHAHEAALDEALGMQSISIRVPRQLVEHYKLIAHFHKIGYQPLMRDVMSRWVPGALKEIFEIEQAKASRASDNAKLVVEYAEEPEQRKAA